MRVPNQTKKLLTLAIALLVGFTAQAQLTADFTANTTSGCNTPFTVQFTDLSTPGANPIAFWIWHFGNGATSTLQNPVATYSAPGIYDVKLVVYDNFTDGDSIVKVGYIEVGNNMVLTGTPTPITCFNNGEMTVSATGGTAPYTYSWSNGQTTQTATGLTPYYAQFGVGVTVTDDNGCNAVQVFPVPYQPAYAVSGSVTTPPSCGGGTNGTIELTASGAILPVEYSLDGSTWYPSGVFTGISAGDIGYFVRDVTGCMVHDTLTVASPSLNVTFALTTPITCSGDNDGVLTSTVTGGTAPYTYYWIRPNHGGGPPPPPPGPGDYFLDQVDSGFYSLGVVDVNGCTGSFSTLISDPDLIYPNAAVIDASCGGCNNGSIELNPAGGNGGYTYTWSNGSVLSMITGLNPATYTVTVTDVNGCTATRGYVVGISPCSIDVSIAADSPFCIGSSNVTATPIGGTAPFTYQWNSGETTAAISPTIEGPYEVTVTDAQGCSAHDTIDLWQVISTVVNDDTILCYGDTAWIFAGGGGTYTWSPAASLSSATGDNVLAFPTATTTYTVIIDNGTCTATHHVTVTIDSTCTWPGDADNSGLVDNDDVLAIGLGYGDSGPVRLFASLVWEGQYGIDWANSLPSGTNHRYVDTNGDGIINDDDTLAISLNYGLSHAKTDEEREVFVPSIYIVLPDSVSAGQSVQGQVYLGSDSLPLSNIYGIKFSMNYNPNFIEDGSVSFSFGPSWMGTPGTDLLTFQKDLHANGRIDGTITGTNHMNRNGFGLIGLANFTMKDDISGKDFIAEPLLFTFTNIRAINAVEAEVDVTGGETTTIATQVVGIGEIKNNLPVSIYPNPAQGVVYINTYNQAVQHIALRNALGATFEVGTTQKQGLYKLDMENLPAGMYIITIQSGNHVATERVVISK